MPKENKCRGSSKALGYGCGTMVIRYKLCLCKTCFFDWLNNTEAGKEYSTPFVRSTIKKVRKAKQKRKYVKWEDKSTNEMITYIQENICNPYIRERDIQNGYRCISSGGVIEHAGHCFSRGESPGMRFNIMNIHGQRGMENTHKHGDFQNYKEVLINRHGQKYFDKLEDLNFKSKKNKVLDRQEVIRIGKTYKALAYKRIWCFDHDEFENYKDLFNK